MIKHLDKENFQEEIAKDFVIVDFFATWCGPCQMITQELEKINEEILKVDTDKFSTIAREFGIMSIPTLIFFKNKEEVYRHVGFASQEEIEQLIKEYK